MCCVVYPKWPVIQKINFADIVQDLGGSTAELLITTTEKIKEEQKNLQDGNDSGFKFLLSGVVKRDHLSLESTLESNARDVEVSGQYGFSAATQTAINRYYDEISKQISPWENMEVGCLIIIKNNSIWKSK